MVLLLRSTFIHKCLLFSIVIWPDYPRFPGPIFFNVTMDVNEELPIDRIEMDLEVGIKFFFELYTIPLQVRHAVTGLLIILCTGC